MPLKQFKTIAKWPSSEVVPMWTLPAKCFSSFTDEHEILIKYLFNSALRLHIFSLVYFYILIFIWKYFNKPNGFVKQ